MQKIHSIFVKIFIRIFLKLSKIKKLHTDKLKFHNQKQSALY